MVGKKWFKLILLFAFLISSCEGPTTATNSESTIPTTDAREVKTAGAIFNEEIVLGETNIKINGDPSDWRDYPVLAEDLQEDQEGGEFDIKSVRGFMNDKYLYLMIETYQPPSEYAQIDLDISTGGMKYIASFQPQNNSLVFLGDVSDGSFQEIGNVNGSSSSVLAVVETKIPLSVFGTINNLQVDVRAMGGECCDAPEWYAIDRISSISVPEINEIEPGSNMPKMCKEDMPTSIPFGESNPALSFQLAEGYSAEWFVAPGPFNMPQETLLTPEGKILVYAVRSHTLSEVSLDGSVTTIAEDVWGYQGTANNKGDVVLHMHPNGWLTRISPDGDVERIIESNDLTSACDSGISFGPDGDLYIAISDCEGSGNLYSISETGTLTFLGAIPDLSALRLAPDGRLIGASSNSIYEICLEDYSVTLVSKIPEGEIASGGLAFDDKGLLYISTGGRRNSGTLYKMDISTPNPDAELIATIPENGIAGIEWLPSTGTVIGGQLRHGSILSVSLDGEIDTIIAGNGIITPMGIEFSPCGELAVPNDDGGMMSIVYPDGSVSWFMDYISFIPPTPFVAFDPNGTMYTSEGAPMLMPQRISVLKSGDIETLQTLTDAEYPSGLARRSDGILFFSETTAGKISQIASDGTTSTFIDGLIFPQAIAFDMDGNLYAIIGKPSGFDLIDNPEVFPAPSVGDQVIKINPSGEIIDSFNLEGASAVAVNSQNHVFISVSNMFSPGRESRVMTKNEEGELEKLVTGFESAVGLAFDIAGNLYVSDEHMNGILRIGGFPQGKLNGIVVDQNGVAVAGARVHAVRTVPKVVGQIVFTNEKGEFELTASESNYAIHVQAEGYEQTTLHDVFVDSGQITNVSVKLRD